jgi:hypothetical protein
MGYRSQVVMAVSPRKLGDLLTAVAINKEAFELFQHGLEEGKKNYQEEGDVLLVWSYIKWYSSFDCVGAFDKFIEIMIDEGHDEEYRFVRVGEEADDIFCVGDYALDIYPSTSIVY